MTSPSDFKRRRTARAALERTRRKRLKEMAELAKEVERARMQPPLEVDAHARWQYEVESLRQRIAAIEGTVAAMGGAWREGQVRYFRRLLDELLAAEPGK